MQAEGQKDGLAKPLVIEDPTILFARVSTVGGCSVRTFWGEKIKRVNFY